MPVQFDSDYPTLTLWADFPAPIGSVDITSWFVQAQPFNGATDAEQAPRFTASMAVLLENWDGRFDRHNLSGPYVSGGVSFVRRGVPIRLTATWAGVTRHLFSGKALRWDGDWVGSAIEGLDSLTVLTCEGLYGALARWPGAPTSAVGANELSGARFSRIMSAFGWSGATNVAVGVVPMTATTLEGDGISQILDVVDAEGGAFYIEPDGTAVFEDRASLVTNTRSNTSQATFSEGSLFFRNAVPVSGDDRIVNTVRLSGTDPVTGDTVTVTSTDAASVATHGPLGYTRSGLPTTDIGFLQGSADFLVARWKDAQPFIQSVTIDPVQSPALMWPHALGRRIHDRVTVTGVNARSGGTLTRNVFIIGVAHDISQLSWSTTFYFADATAWTSFQASRWDVGNWDSMRWFY